MNLFDISAVLITAAALDSYINYKYIKLSYSIGLLLLAMGAGFLFFLVANFFGIPNINLLYAMLFGIIFSPTDPIAVLSIIKKMHASKQIETKIVGESLFNDCIAIVLFIAVLQLISVNTETSIFSVIKLLFIKVGGGIVFGGLIGWLAYQMLLRIDNYSVELLITLGIATGGYALAEKLNFSSPLAMVIVGIIIGNHGRTIAMSEQSSDGTFIARTNHKRIIFTMYLLRRHIFNCYSMLDLQKRAEALQPENCGRKSCSDKLTI